MSVADDRRKLTFGEVYNRVSIAAIGLILWYVGSKINELSINVQILKEYMATSQEKSNNVVKQVDRFEIRLTDLERKVDNQNTSRR